MRDHDPLVDQAVLDEERDLLRRIGEEPGFFGQAFSLFGGKTGWVNVVLMLAQSVAFVAGGWAAWKFFHAEDPLSALRWGLPSAVLLLTSLILKLSLWPVMQTNRVLQEIKRVELLARHREQGRP